MAPAAVIRRRLVWPNASEAAMPDPRAFAAVAAISVADSVTLNVAGVSTYEAAAQRIDIPDGTVAIGIAPDSLIACCDISLDGSPANAIRVSAGNPMVGCFPVGSSAAFVTVPAMAAAIVADPASTVAPGAVKNVAGDYAWPLVLEFMIGCVLPIRSNKRAPMVAEAVALTTDSRSIYACVDGREKIAVRVSAEAQAVTINAITAYGTRITLAGGIADNAVGLALDDTGALTDTIAAGTSKLYTLSAPPLAVFIEIQVESSVAGGVANVTVRAEDD